MFACDCLNVIIEPESNDFLKVTKDILRLTDTEKDHCFFTQEIKQILKLHKITKKISALVETKQIGTQWVVNRCINCDVYTHALHRDRGAALVLVACKLMSNEDIEEIRNNENFSTVYDIQVMDSNIKEFALTQSFLTEQESTISCLRQKLYDYINRETAITEAKIAIYSEEQYKLLDVVKERAFKEHHLLRRKMMEYNGVVPDNNATSTNIATNLSRDHLTTGSPAREVPENIASTNSSLVSRNKENVNNKTPTKKISSSSVSSNRIRNNAISFDSETLFPLEDMADEPTLEQSDFEESSDAEDTAKEENSEPSRQRAPTQLAKSLPVNIPVFMSAFQNHQSEDIDDDLPDESMDIAASIKALAKSIQGSTVFGELPRPRFSSQI